MKIIEAIRHYDRDKSQYGPLSGSLSPKIVQLMSVFGQLDANSTGPELAARAQAALPKAAPGTILRVLGQLRAVLRVAERDGLIQRAPHITMPAVYDVVDCPISPAEGHMLLRHMRWTATAHWPLAMLLLYTGARASEAMRLSWSDIMDDGVRIRKPAAKRTKTVTRIVPMTRQLRDAWAGGAFTSLKPTTDAAEVKRRTTALGVAVKSACRDLGLPEIRVHDLRHLFAAVVAEAGGDLGDIAYLLGHAKLQTTLRYRGFVREKAERVLANV